MPRRSRPQEPRVAARTARFVTEDALQRADAEAARGSMSTCVRGAVTSRSMASRRHIRREGAPEGHGGRAPAEAAAERPAAAPAAQVQHARAALRRGAARSWLKDSMPTDMTASFASSSVWSTSPWLSRRRRGSEELERAAAPPAVAVVDVDEGRPPSQLRGAVLAQCLASAASATATPTRSGHERPQRVRLQVVEGGRGQRQPARASPGRTGRTDAGPCRPRPRVTGTRAPRPSVVRRFERVPEPVDGARQRPVPRRRPGATAASRSRRPKRPSFESFPHSASTAEAGAGALQRAGEVQPRVGGSGLEARGLDVGLGRARGLLRRINQ